MSSEAMDLDDIVATMMSMGFEFQDCQDAIQNGKLTVQAGIEWILAGKPNNVTSQPAPSLNLTSGPNLPLGNQSNPFVPASSDVSDTANSAMETDEDQIVSRSHLSDKQHQIKRNFEEKQRLEAKKRATEDKRNQKLERDRVLKEIQADREKQKLTRSSGARVSPPATAPSASTDSGSSTQQQQPAANTHDKANIQVRLPSGQVFRESFSSSASLDTVWDSVCKKFGNVAGYSGFMQPFPRKEFSEEEMKQSLRDLSLVPSGSLVLKKKEAAVQISQPEPQPPPVVEERGENAENEMEEENAAAAAVGHQWGQGHQIQEEHQWGQGHQIQEGGPGVMEALNDDMEVADPINQIPGLNNNPVLGMGNDDFGWGGGAQDQQGAVFEGFGNRLVPEGVPGDHGAHRNRSAAQMAAEAAAQRFALPAPSPAPAASTHTDLIYQVPSLQHIAMKLLAHALIDPRQPIVSISGLSEELLQNFITFLKKERLLKPKILPLIPSYLLKLDLDYYPYATNELLIASRIFVHLQMLSVKSSTFITDAALKCVKGMKNLKVLNLSGCTNLTDFCFSVVKECPSLQKLCLDGTHITDAGISQLCSQGGNESLSHLDLSRTALTHHIFHNLRSLPKLKTLILKQSKISSLSGVEEIVHLENLDVSDTQIVTDSILCLTRHQHLCNIVLSGTLNVHGDTALSYLQDMKLTALSLPMRDTTTNVGLAYISKFNLTSLDLSNYTNISDEAFLYVGQILSLKTLLLSNTKLTDDGMLDLKNLSKLQVLNLDRTFIGNAGAMVVKNFKYISELSLSQTRVTDEFLKEGVLNKCSYLTKLNLSRTQITNKGAVELRIPNLVMLNLDGTQVLPTVVDVIKANCSSTQSVSILRVSTS